MTKEAVIITAQEMVQQKTALASAGGAVGAVTTWGIEGINPYIPVLSFTAMVVFGVVNLWFNYRRLTAAEKVKDNGD